ncbi:MAG: phosphopantetheine-binding protein [Verrucomicrobiota bacterium]|nr:phosphopantetheine-binding protein [Verrucomicrobiota bacterium]
MSAETTAQRVIRVIAKDKKLPPEQLTPETKFEDLMMDSLDALNMIFALEEEFDISVPNADAVKMRSVGDAIAGVEQLLAQKASETSPT